MEHASENEVIRTKPSQARGKERIHIILVAAHDLFHERGIDVVTTNDIALAAGVPIGSIYRYFPNKEAIILALADAYIDEVSDLFELIGGQLRYTKLSWEEVITLIIDAWATYARLNGSFGYLFFQITTPTLREAIKSRRERLTNAFGKLLRKRCPELDDGAVVVCYRFVWVIKNMVVWPELPAEESPALYKGAARTIAQYLEQACTGHHHI